ncbi:MAG: hypothetical protein ISS48_01195 [Candidatus Aenigmarchaeota archaeon]|nr:hypothetical protein [Candidatus Aenigmarchaeota archaeon]
MDDKLKQELIEEKLRFTRIWVDHILKSPNKVWSSEQKRFIDALFENHRKNKID